MREACPDCDYITIKEALLSTAIDDGYGTPGDDNTYGHGFIDAYAAVLAVMTERIDDLTIYPAGNDVVLRWSAMPFATFYRIYTSPTSEDPWTLLDSTTATVYTHINGAAEPRLSYDVRACSP